MNIKSKRVFIAEKIASLIQSGELPMGSKLPRGTEFAKELGVSHITLRGALEDLAKAGLVTSRQDPDHKRSFPLSAEHQQLHSARI